MLFLPIVRVSALLVSSFVVALDGMGITRLQASTKDASPIPVHFQGASVVSHHLRASIKVDSFGSVGGVLFVASHAGRLSSLWRLKSGKAREISWPGVQIPMSIQFVSPSMGWILTRSLSLYRTTNGGGSWQYISLKKLGNISWAQSVQFDALNETKAWLLLSGPQAAFQSEKMLFSTRDGGHSWVRISESPMGGPLQIASWPKFVQHGLPLDGGSPTIHFVSSKLGFLTTQTAGGENYLLSTYDGGRSWIAQTVSDLPSSAWVTGVQTLGMSWIGRQGWEIVQSSDTYLLHSEGPNFTYIGRLPFRVNDDHSLSFVSNLDGAMLGEIAGRSLILSTHDSGRHWVAYEIPRSIQPLNARILSTGNGIWILSGNQLYQSNDHGKVWHQVSLPR